MLPSWMRKINHQVSGLKFEIIAGETYEGMISLSSGRCDLLMAYHSPIVPMSIDERSCPSVSLGSDRLVPVCRPDESGAPMYRLTEAKLRHLPILSYPPETFFGRICNGLIRFRPSDPCFNVVAQSPQARILHALAREGAGIAWLPEHGIKQELFSGQMALAGDEEWTIPVDIRLYASQERSRLLHANLWENIREMHDQKLAIS